MKTPEKTTSTAVVPRDQRMLSAEQFHRLAEVPAVIEWLANAGNPRTQRAYSHHVKDFAALCRHPGAW